MFLDGICLKASHLLKWVAMLCFLFQHVRLSLFKSRYFLSQAKDNICRGSDSPNVACRKFVSRNDCRLVVCFLSKIWSQSDWLLKRAVGRYSGLSSSKGEENCRKRGEEDFHLGLKERLGLGVEVVLTCRTHKRGFFFSHTNAACSWRPGVFGQENIVGKMLLIKYLCSSALIWFPWHHFTFCKFCSKQKPKLNSRIIPQEYLWLLPTPSPLWIPHFVGGWYEEGIILVAAL